MLYFMVHWTAQLHFHSLRAHLLSINILKAVRCRSMQYAFDTQESRTVEQDENENWGGKTQTK